MNTESIRRREEMLKDFSSRLHKVTENNKDIRKTVTSSVEEFIQLFPKYNFTSWSMYRGNSKYENGDFVVLSENDEVLISVDEVCKQVKYDENTDVMREHVYEILVTGLLRSVALNPSAIPED